jgi:7,8-dihydro-6-hydroxymethylpterin-pyrophosphokinase
MGRTRSGVYEARTIDLDIMFYGNEVIHEHSLTIPHHLLHKRKFALVPLNELIPSFIHPVFKKSIDTLLLECDDNSPVTLWLPSTTI